MKIANISDLHFGASRLTGAEKDFMLSTLANYKPELLIIAGDYWNAPLKADNEVLYEGLHFYKDILSALPSSCRIRIIRGTLSHDGGQSKLFQLFSENFDYLYFDKVCNETIDGFNILWVPEEYVKDDYYEQWLPDAFKWDLIAMHGMTDLHAGYRTDGERNIRSATKFKNKFLRDKATLVMAGHVHIPMQYENFISLGTFARFCFGEEEPKGMWLIDLQKNEYSSMFVENTFAKKFDTHEVDGGIFNKENFEALVYHILQLLQHSNVRLSVSRFDETQNSIIRLTENTVKQHNKNENIFKIIRTREIRQQQEVEEAEEANISFDPTKISVNDAIQKFIKEQYNVELPLDTISKYLDGGSSK